MLEKQNLIPAPWPATTFPSRLTRGGLGKATDPNERQATAGVNCFRGNETGRSRREVSCTLVRDAVVGLIAPRPALASL